MFQLYIHSRAYDSMETIKYVSELVVEDQDACASLQHRIKVLQQFQAASGIGPLDFVWIKKKASGAFGTVYSTSFHHVLGKDMSSTASGAAYFADLCNRVEQIGVISGLFTAQQWKVQECIYCSFDAISRMDIQCHMKTPGGVSAVAVDARGSRFEVRPMTWKQLSISVFLRYEHYNCMLFLDTPGLVRVPAIENPDVEAELMQDILDAYCAGVVQQAYPLLEMDPFGSARPEDDDIVLCAVLQHFRRRRSWDAAAEFFGQLSSVYPAAVLQLSAAFRESGRIHDSLQVLRDSAVHRNSPPGARLALALGESSAASLLGSEDAAAAIADASLLARHSALHCPDKRSPWLCLASIWAREGAATFALLALNSVPAPDDDNSCVDVAFPLGLMPYKRATCPRVGPCDPDAYELHMLAEESAWALSSDDDDPQLRSILPAGVFHDSSQLPASCVAVSQHIRASAYDSLVSLLDNRGWEDLLAIRKRLFSLDDEDTSKRGSMSNNARSEGPGSHGEPAPACASSARRRTSGSPPYSGAAHPVNDRLAPACAQTGVCDGATSQSAALIMPVPRPPCTRQEAGAAALQRNAHHAYGLGVCPPERHAPGAVTPQTAMQCAQSPRSSWSSGATVSPRFSSTSERGLSRSARAGPACMFAEALSRADVPVQAYIQAPAPLPRHQTRSDPQAARWTDLDQSRPRHASRQDDSGMMSSAPLPAGVEPRRLAARGHTRRCAAGIHADAAVLQPQHITPAAPAVRERSVAARSCNPDLWATVYGPPDSMPSGHVEHRPSSCPTPPALAERHRHPGHDYCRPASQPVTSKACAAYGGSAGSAVSEAAARVGPVRAATFCGAAVQMQQLASSPGAVGQFAACYGPAPSSIVASAASGRDACLPQADPGPQCAAGIQIQRQHGADSHEGMHVAPPQRGPTCTSCAACTAQTADMARSTCAMCEAATARTADHPRGDRLCLGRRGRSGVAALQEEREDCAAARDGRQRDARPDLRQLQDLLQQERAGMREVSSRELARAQIRAQEHAAMLAGRAAGGHCSSGQRCRRGLRGVSEAAPGQAVRDERGAPVLSPSTARAAERIFSEEALACDISLVVQRARDEGLLHATNFSTMIALLKMDPRLEHKKHLLAPWLDDVINLVYADLMTFTEWRVADQALLRKTGRTSVATVLNEPDTIPAISEHAPAWLASLDFATAAADAVCVQADATPGDWLARATASERLLQLRDAERAFRCAHAVAGFSATALLGLARIYSLSGFVEQTLSSLTELLLHTDRLFPWSEYRRTSAAVLAAMSALIEAAGMKATQAALEADSAQYHPALEVLAELAFEWGTDGCDA